MKYFIGLLAVCLMSFGCAFKEDVQMTQAYYNASNRFEQEQTEQVEVKSTTIAEVMSFECPQGTEGTELCGMAKAYAGALASTTIAGIQTKEFKLKPMKTSVDAQIVALEKLGDGIPFFTIGAVSVKAIDKDKGSVSNNVNNGGSIDNKFEENHATSFGDESPTTNAPSRGDSTKTFTDDRSNSSVNGTDAIEASKEETVQHPLEEASE